VRIGAKADAKAAREKLPKREGGVCHVMAHVALPKYFNLLPNSLLFFLGTLDFPW
jgi:hypothetical protein